MPLDTDSLSSLANRAFESVRRKAARAARLIMGYRSRRACWSPHSSRSCGCVPNPRKSPPSWPRAESSGPSLGTSVLNASGYVVARRMSTVSSKVTGKIAEIFVEEGMAVKEGSGAGAPRSGELRDHAHDGRARARSFAAQSHRDRSAPRRCAAQSRAQRSAGHSSNSSARRRSTRRRRKRTRSPRAWRRRRRR